MYTAFFLEKSTKKMGIAGQLGITLAQSLGNYLQRGLDNIIGIDRDQEQVDQQKKLTDIQINANKILSDKTFALQKDMYNYQYEKNTPEAIKNNLVKAGLNPALIYGMNAGGGVNASTGSTSAGTATGATSSDSSSRMQAETARQELALQREMVTANIDATKATAEKTKAEAEKIKGVDTENAKQDLQNKKEQNNYINKQIEKLNEDINIQKHQEKLIDLQSNSLKIANNFNTKNNEELLLQNATITKNMIIDNEIKNETKLTAIELFKQNLKLTISHIAKNNSEIKLNDEKINEIINNIYISNEKLTVDKNKLTNDMNIALINQNNGRISKEARGIVKVISESINMLTGKNTMSNPYQDEREYRKYKE